MDNPGIEFWRLAAQLGSGVFMGCFVGLILYLLNRQQLAASEARHTNLLSSFQAEQNAERDRNDRNLVRHWEELGRLRDAFELAKCRYDGQCHQWPEDRRPPPHPPI